jgi:hypothetical protein
MREKMTTSEIFTEAKRAKLELHAMTMKWTSGFHCSFESNEDGMSIKGSAESDESLDDAVAQAWEKFTRLANHGNPKLLAPMIEHQRA